MKKRDSIALLGKVVKEERKKRELTQTELGDFAGVGINFIYGLENGKSGLSLDKVLDVLNVLGIQLKIEFGKNEIIK